MNPPTSSLYDLIVATLFTEFRRVKQATGVNQVEAHKSLHVAKTQETGYNMARRKPKVEKVVETDESRKAIEGD